jgi:hypothetical protein
VKLGTSSAKAHAVLSAAFVGLLITLMRTDLSCCGIVR